MKENSRRPVEIPLKEKILEKFIYDKKSGTLISRRENKVLKNKRNGYLSVKIEKRQFYVHRLIYFLETGDEPKLIDHIDGNMLNNHIFNLRESNKSLNSANKPKYFKNATSKYKGVCKPSDKTKWVANIKVMKKNIQLGYYEKEEEAALAYNKAAIKYFGEHAYLNEIKENE